MSSDSNNTAVQSAPTFVAAVVISPLIFQVGFNFNAFEVIVIEHLLAVWVASLAAFAATFVVGAKNAPGMSGRWWFRIALLLPTIWLTTEWMYFFLQIHFLDFFEIIFRWMMMLISLPAILYTLLSVAYPAVGFVANRRLRFGLWAIWIGAGIFGLLIGEFHHHVLTCHDFERSGAFVPDNCWKLEALATAEEA